MKVIAFNGSARKQGNTAILINHVFGELEKEGIETELVELAGKKIQGCTASYKCFETKDRKCAVKNDIVNDCIEKMVEADGIILGSPTYFADITSEMKALIERAGFTAIANGVMFKRKVGAAGRLDQSFLPHQSDDRPGFKLLEHGHWKRNWGC